MKYSIKVALIQIKIIIFLLDDKKLLPIRNSTITSATKTSPLPPARPLIQGLHLLLQQGASFLNDFQLIGSRFPSTSASVASRRCRCVGVVASAEHGRENI